MNFTNDGLSLWYGTPDAVAPVQDGLAPREGASLVIGVHPANPTNKVSVQYRTDSGLVQAVPGREIRTDYERQAQYFAVTFPPFITGEMVEYAPVLSCGGRQVPAPHLSARFPSRFRLVRRPATLRPQGRDSLRPSRSRLVLTPLSTVTVRFHPPQFIGETAAGMRVNFFVRDGEVTGPGLSAKLIQLASDHMTVRRDGVGIVRVRAAITTDDGAVLDLLSHGYVDFGPDGYRSAVAHRLPDRSPVTVSPLVSTQHPKYAWLSRIQCVGLGESHLDAGELRYQLYAPAAAQAAG